MACLSPRRLLLVLLVTSLSPIAVRADHRLDHARLRPVVDSLHRSVLHFEAKACLRPFPRHELSYIQQMTRKSCRLADGVAECARPGRIKADYNVLGSFARVVDRRLERHCATRYDHELMHCWHDVKRQLGIVGCMINGCSPGCTVHPVAPLRPPHVDPRPHDRFQPRYDLPAPPTAYRDPYRHQGSRNNVAPWIDLLMQLQQARQHRRGGFRSDFDHRLQQDPRAQRPANIRDPRFQRDFNSRDLGMTWGRRDRR